MVMLRPSVALQLRLECLIVAGKAELPEAYA